MIDATIVSTCSGGEVADLGCPPQPSGTPGDPQPAGQVLRVHRKVLLVLVGLAKGTEGSHIVGAIVHGDGRHLAMDAKVLVNLCDEFPQEFLCLPFLKTIMINLVYKLNLYRIGTYSF